MNIKGNWGVKTTLINIYEPRQKVVEIKRETWKQKRRETDEITGRQNLHFQVSWQPWQRQKQWGQSTEGVLCPPVLKRTDLSKGSPPGGILPSFRSGPRRCRDVMSHPDNVTQGHRGIYPKETHSYSNWVQLCRRREITWSFPDAQPQK